MNTKFNILNDTIKTNDYIFSIIENINNKEIVLKRNMETSLYNLIEELFKYNLETNMRIKEKCLKDYLLNLSKIDYYLSICYKKSYIKKKKLISSTNYLTNLRKMCYGLFRLSSKGE